MKTLLIPGILLALTLVAPAQEIETKGSRLMELKTATKARKPAPNQIVTKKVAYDGVAVQAVKAENPVQMINPVAPAEYGTGEQNVSRDPETKKVRGLALFRLSW